MSAALLTFVLLIAAALILTRPRRYKSDLDIRREAKPGCGFNEKERARVAALCGLQIENGGVQ